MASNQWIYNTFGVGNNNLRMPTKSVIEGYGLKVSGDYASNQLVARDDISVGLVSIPLYVIVRSTDYSWNYGMPVYHAGQYKYAAYFNLVNNNRSSDGYVLFQGGAKAPFYINTSINSAGDNWRLSMAFSYEQEYYVTSSFSNFYVYPGERIQAVYLPNIDFLIYDSSGWQINSSNPTSDASYALSFAFKQSGIWRTPITYWRSSYGYTISSCTLGDLGNTTLDTGSSFYDYNLNSNNLQGFAICIDRWGSGGGDYSSE